MIIRVTTRIAIVSTAVCLSLALAGCQRQALEGGTGTTRATAKGQSGQPATRQVTLAITGMT